MTDATLNRIGDAIPGFTAFRAVVAREFIDNRAGFITTPLVIGALLILLIAGSLMLNNLSFANIHIDGDGIDVFASPEELAEAINGMESGALRNMFAMGLMAIAAPILLAAPFVMFFALLGTLYDDRRDRSFLFWKSMPVSDTREVLTKLVTIVFLAPMVFIAVAAVVQLALLIFVSISALAHGWPVVGLLWSSAPTVTLWLSMAINYLVLALWALPLAAWLLAVSAYASKSPFLYAVIPPVAANLLERMFLGTDYIGSWISGRLEKPMTLFGQVAHDIGIRGDGNALKAQFLSAGYGIETLGQTFASVDFWFGAAVAAGLIAVAVWLRRYHV